MKKTDFDIILASIKQLAQDDIEVQYERLLSVCRELQKAYKEQSPELMLCGILQVVYEGLSYLSMLNEFTTLFVVIDNHSKLTELKQYYFEQFIGNVKKDDFEMPTCGILGFKETRNIDMLDSMICNVYKLGLACGWYDLQSALIEFVEHKKNNTQQFDFKKFIYI